MFEALIHYSDGTSEKLELLRQDTGRGFTVTLPKEKLQKPVEAIDFMQGFAPAKEGEDGYIVYKNILMQI